MLDDLDHGSALLTKPPKHLDYSLTGENATLAVEKGLGKGDRGWIVGAHEFSHENEIRTDHPVCRAI